MNSRHTRNRNLAVMLTALMVAVSAGVVSADDANGKAKINIGGLTDKTTGVIKGVVKYKGKTPPRKPVRMAQDPVCDKAHPADKPALSEVWVFGKNNDTLQNVFVYVSKGLTEKVATPKEAKVLDQRGCLYIPHVQGIMVNQPLKILNSDPTLHNVQAFPMKNPPFNDGMPVKGMVLDKKFAKAEMGMMFKCAVHPWMTAYVHVMDNPFYAVTQDDGTFEIRGLPDGTYEISTKHMFSRFAPDSETVTVTVAGGKADKDVTITYAPK